MRKERLTAQEGPSDRTRTSVLLHWLTWESFHPPFDSPLQEALGRRRPAKKAGGPPPLPVLGCVTLWPLCFRLGHTASGISASARVMRHASCTSTRRALVAANVSQCSVCPPPRLTVCVSAPLTVEQPPVRSTAPGSVPTSTVLQRVCTADFRHPATRRYAPAAARCKPCGMRLCTFAAATGSASHIRADTTSLRTPSMAECSVDTPGSDPQTPGRSDAT
ncbi:hypothetical protein V8E36_002267 [Tilletia maclaganii]